MSSKTPRDIPHPPLITPSASPPPRSLHEKAIAISPSKRQRTTSVPRSSSSRRSASVFDPNLDIQRERDASRARLLDTWSHLAERYARPLDEDDIVDIRTGEIIKDNGFWRSTRQYRFGEVLAPVDTEEVGTAESDDEDGFDELDAFPDEHDFLEDVFARGLQRLPSESGTPGPGDEDDLDDFLEAEKRRKEEYGSDFEEEYEPTRISSARNSSSPSLTSRNESDNDDGGNRDQNDGQAGVSHTSDEFNSEESGSDDELDNWEPTEASIIVVSGDIREESSEDQSDSSSEVEIVESPAPQKPAASYKPRTPPLQLNTPPNSHSSFNQPIPSYIDIPRISSPSPSPLLVESPQKMQALASERGTHDNNSRAPTPEVIDLTDDEVEICQSQPVLSTVSSPSRIPPLVRARNRALVVPQVVITTLPPRSSQTKGTAPTSAPESDLDTPTKRAGKFAPLEESPPPIKGTTGTTRSRPMLKTKKNSQGPKPTQPAGKMDTVAKSRKDAQNSRREVSVPQDVSNAEASPLREPSQEVEERPLGPAPTKKRPYIVLSNGSQPPSRTTRKRKRVPSQHENVTQVVTDEETTPEIKQSKACVTAKGRATSASPQQSPRRSRLDSRNVVSVSHRDLSGSDEDENYLRHRTVHRFASVATTSRLQLPCPPHPTPSYFPEMYPPAVDPRAQQIITSAMQQLAALLWTPTHSSTDTLIYPRTPTHHRYSSIGPGLASSTPDHPHPYPFSFDPSFSKATLPPSSPELPSSPIKPRQQKKSLVSRSRSRGRRVSFIADEKNWSYSEDSGSELAASEPRLTTGLRPYSQNGRSRSSQQSQGKGKGKGKNIERDVSSSESGTEEDEVEQREQREKSTRSKLTKARKLDQVAQLSGGPSIPSPSPSKLLNTGPSKSRAKYSRGLGD